MDDVSYTIDSNRCGRATDTVYLSFLDTHQADIEKLKRDLKPMLLKLHG